MKNGLNSNGYIETEVSFDKIKPRHKAILDRINEDLVQNFSKKIHSIYLYGSVATGKAKNKVSDLDILIVFKKKLDAVEMKKLEEIQNKLTEQHLNSFREIGLESVDLVSVLNKQHLSGYACFIKHLCVFLWGVNLQAKFPKFKPTIAVAFEFNGDLEKVMKKAKEKLKKFHNSNENELQKKSIMKKIIRTSFGLVMPRNNSWTTDLKIMSQTFIQYYPEYENQIKTALQWAKLPPQNNQAIFDFMDDFGVWLIREFKTKITDKML